MAHIYAPQPFYAHAHDDYRGLVCGSFEQYCEPSLRPVDSYPNEIQIYHSGSEYQNPDLPWKSRYTARTATYASPPSSSGSSPGLSSSQSSTSTSYQTAKHVALLEQVLAECDALERLLDTVPALDGKRDAGPKESELKDAEIVAMGFVPPGQWTHEIERESWKHYEEAFIPHRLRSMYNRPAVTQPRAYTSTSAQTSPAQTEQSVSASPAPSALAIRRQATVPLPIDPFCDLLAGAYQETPPRSACTTASESRRGPLLFAPVSKKRLAKRQSVFLSAADQAKALCWLPADESQCASPKRLLERVGQWPELLVGQPEYENGDEDEARGRGRSRTARPIW
ncbi:hypothetical protein AURDEDRAFT_163195 [Auricularia subglabra TFB-10046 SS5]|nr:hypothetical protein AURDEDRAFT_163195 [Auricularia subglabra TFB-10046 SS5]